VATTTNTQTELKRKAAARRAQATRLRNQSKNGSFVESATTRTKAETNTLRAASYEAGRAFDASLGAAGSVRDSVAGAVRPLGDPRGAISRFRESAGRKFDRMERRGSRTRHRVQREAGRLGGRAKRSTRQRVPA
jgi:hypothetical protein